MSDELTPEEIPSYEEFKTKYGSRPKDIIYKMAVKLAGDYYKAQLAKRNRPDRGEIAKIIVTLDGACLWSKMTKAEKAVFLNKADQILALCDKPKEKSDLREQFLTDLRLLEERKTSPEWIVTKYMYEFLDKPKETPAEEIV